MPDRRRTPRFALAAAFDARPWSGLDVLQRGAADPIGLPTFGTGEGIYLDGLHFLHGFASSQGVNADLAGEDLAITIDPAADVLVVDNTGGADVELEASADNAVFGLPTALTVIPAGGSLTASIDWRRGLVSNGLTSAPPRLTFDIPGTGLVTVPSQPGPAQDIRVILRHRGALGDLDDTSADTLEGQENNALGEAGIRWAVDDEGHVVVAGDVAGAQAGITWLSTTFRDRLGFTGDEPVTTDRPGGAGAYEAGYTYYQRAARPFPGLIVPRRPLMTQDALQREVSHTVGLIDGRYSSTHIGSYLAYAIEWVLDGPDGAVDLHRHWLDLRRHHLHAGEPVTLYQNWGDSRRALDPLRVTVDQVAYDLITTSERAGYRGRVLCRLSPDTADEEQVEWEGALRLRARMSHRLELREDGV